MARPTMIDATTIRMVRFRSDLAWSRCIFSIISRRACFCDDALPTVLVFPDRGGHRAAVRMQCTRRS
jgi:hypothetical protein